MAVKISVKNRFKGKSQQEQLGLVAEVLRNSNIEYLDGDKEEVEAICKLLETTGVTIDDKGKLHMSKASADMLCKVLSRGDVKVKAKDLKTLPDLVERIDDLSKGLDISENTIRRLSGDLTKSKTELESAKKSLTGALNEKAEAEKSLKSAKRKERNAKIVATILAVTTALGITFSAITGIKANKNKTELENTKATVETLTGENQDLNDQLADLGAQLGLSQEELNQIAGIIGAQKGEDISDKVLDAITNAGGTVVKDPELDEVKDALGDHYTGGDVSDAVAGVVAELAGTKKELDEVEAILAANNQQVLNKDVSAAVLNLIESLSKGEVVTPEDGVSQKDVDAVYNAVIEGLSGLGITAADLTDKEGNFTLDKVTPVIKGVVEEVITARATATNIENKANGVLGVIFKGDATKDDVKDYASTEAAMDAIEDYFVGKMTTIANEFKVEGKEVPESFVYMFDFVLEGINAMQEDYDKAITDLETAKKAIVKLEKQLDEQKDTNSNQNDTEKNENTEGKAPVSGEDPKDETNPNQNKPNPDKGGEEEDEPDFN